MRPTLASHGLRFQRQQRTSPYAQLAEELGYARTKTARDNVAKPYRQVAVTNAVFRSYGLEARVCELMAVVDASMMGAIPSLADALYRHNLADAEEDVSESEWIRNTSDQHLTDYIKKLADEIRNSEILLAALIRERDARKADQ